jgi:HlyD family secretion protein
LGAASADVWEVDDPRRDIWVGAAVFAAFVIAFVGWGSLVRLDAAAVAQGEVSVAGHRQTVQNKEGGVISAIHVKEAQRVKAGDVLIELAAADARANERSIASDVIGLEAQRARLEAEQVGAPAIQWPAEFAQAQPEDAALVRRAQTVQLGQFKAHAAAIATQKNVLSQKSGELGEVVRGYQSQIASADRQQQLLGQEVQGMQSLADRGYAPLNRVRDLQRTQAEINGQRGQYEASVAQSHMQARETQLTILQVEKDDGDKIAEQLRDTQASLDAALPKLAAAKDEVARAEIRAPAAGTVVGLTVFTVGGVIAPGQRLMDIVPDRAPLMIEARVSPNDAQDMHAGQAVEVRFPSLHDRSLPILEGRVMSVSADSLVDERTGQRYFTAQVSVPESQLEALEKQRGATVALRPGLPAQVVAPVRKRTALQYLLEPFGDAFWRSFRER